MRNEENVAKPDTTDLDRQGHVAISVENVAPKADVSINCAKDSFVSEEVSQLSEKEKRNWRVAMLLLTITILIVGRFSVPDNEIKCIEDKVMTALQFANDFINAVGNHHYRAGFQILCSLMVDTVFIITFGYWVIKGSGGRLPVTMLVFYGTRAIVQSFWFSPFPQGFYWDTPGIPSLVVPYGRGSDFFFSGHSGFLVICACEWHKLKMPKVRNFVITALIYTILILLTFRIHYSIDVFVGVFFGEWCFGKVDQYKDSIDGFWSNRVRNLKSLINKNVNQVRSIFKLSGEQKGVIIP